MSGAKWSARLNSWRVLEQKAWTGKHSGKTLSPILFLTSLDGNMHWVTLEILLMARILQRMLQERWPYSTNTSRTGQTRNSLNGLWWTHWISSSSPTFIFISYPGTLQEINVLVVRLCKFHCRFSSTFVISFYLRHRCAPTMNFNRPLQQMCSPDLDKRPTTIMSILLFFVLTLLIQVGIWLFSSCVSVLGPPGDRLRKERQKEWETQSSTRGKISRVSKNPCKRSGSRNRDAHRR